MRRSDAPHLWTKSIHLQLHKLLTFFSLWYNIDVRHHTICNITYNYKL